jgi:hypothetical protein
MFHLREIRRFVHWHEIVVRVFESVWVKEKPHGAPEMQHGSRVFH